MIKDLFGLHSVLLPLAFLLGNLYEINQNHFQMKLEEQEWFMLVI